MTSCYMKTEASMKICKFSTETKDYLSCFYSILDSMVQNMDSIELCDSISHNFIAQMIPHHQAAIEMANNLLNHSCWLPLRRIATNIISSQTKSIDSMCDSLDCCDEPINSQCDQDLYNRHFHNIMHTMSCEMDTARSTNNINANFIRQMIPHHLGGIRMSENALHYDICPELVPILHSIIVSQRRGIQEMQHLLRCISC